MPLWTGHGPSTSRSRCPRLPPTRSNTGKARVIWKSPPSASLIASRSRYLIRVHSGLAPATTRPDADRGMGLPLMLALTNEMTVSHLQGTGTSVSLSVYIH